MANKKFILWLIEPFPESQNHSNYWSRVQKMKDTRMEGIETGGKVIGFEFQL